MGDIDRIVRLSPTVQAPLASQRSGDAPRREPQAGHGGHEDALELTNVLEEEQEHQGPPPPEEPGHLDLAV